MYCAYLSRKAARCLEQELRSHAIPHIYAHVFGTTSNPTFGFDSSHLTNTAGFLLCERAENKENFAQLKGAYRISDMLLLDYLGKYYSQSLEKASATN